MIGGSFSSTKSSLAFLLFRPGSWKNRPCYIRALSISEPRPLSHYHGPLSHYHGLFQLYILWSNLSLETKLTVILGKNTSKVGKEIVFLASEISERKEKTGQAHFCLMTALKFKMGLTLVLLNEDSTEKKILVKKIFGQLYFLTVDAFK